jgi:hypothetical protein
MADFTPFVPLATAFLVLLAALVGKLPTPLFKKT